MPNPFRIVQAAAKPAASAKGALSVLPAAEREANLQRMLADSKVQQRLYHGTTATEGGKGQEAIRRIKPSKEGALGSGAYLTPNPGFAGEYAGGAGGNMLPVYAQMKNPLIIEGTRGDPMIEALMKLGMDEDKASRMVERAYENKGYIGKEVQQRAQAQGYDGLMQYRNGDLSEVVTYNPDAVKSAIGNRGTYDTTKPELNEAAGGEIKMAAGGSSGLSVLEIGDMSSPAYRSYLERKQGLEGSYPEAVIAPMVRGAALATKNLLGNIGKPKPGQLSPGHYELANARRDAAMSQLTKQEMDAFYRTGNLPSRFPELLENSSAIGSKVGKIQMPQQATKSLEEKIFDKVIEPTGRRAALDLGLNTANQMQDIYERKGSAPANDDKTKRYAAGGAVNQEDSPMKLPHDVIPRKHIDAHGHALKHFMKGGAVNMRRGGGAKKEPMTLKGELQSLGKPLQALADTGAGLLRGSVAGTLGLPGEIESLGRGAGAAFSAPSGQRLDAFLQGMGQPTVMPRTEDISAKLPSAYSGSDKDRQHNVSVGQTFGEFAPAPGTTAATRAGIKGAKYAGREAARMVDEAMMGGQNVLSPLVTSPSFAVEPAKYSKKVLDSTAARFAEKIAAANPKLTAEEVSKKALTQATKKLDWERTQKPALEKRYGELVKSSYSESNPIKQQNTPAVVQERMRKANEFLDQPTEPWTPPKPELQAFDRSSIKDALEGFPGVEQSRFPRDKPTRANIEHVEELYSDPANRALIEKQIKRGLPLGGETFYASLYPVKQAVLEAGMPAEKFEQWIHGLAPASARNSIMNEMSVGQFLRDMNSRGIPLTEENVAREMAAYKEKFGVGLPLMPIHRQGVANVLEGGQNLREMNLANIPTNYKIPTYGTQKAGDFAKSAVLDVHEAGGHTQGSRFHPYFNEQGGFGNTEYGAGEQGLLGIAQDLGIPGGMAQAGRWFGGGELTGLKSPRGDALDLLEKQVAYTLKQKGIQPNPANVRAEVLRQIETGQGDLLPWYRKEGMPDVRETGLQRAEGGEVKMAAGGALPTRLPKEAFC